MSGDTTYNGWRNRSTWLINLWFIPCSLDHLESIRKALEERVGELANSKDTVENYLSDLIDLQAIDWDEIAKHLELEFTIRENPTAILNP